MRNVVFAFGALALLSFAHVQPAAAQEAKTYAWCAEVGSAESCAFDTLRQCLATVSGEGQVCAPNPDYAAGFGRGTQGRVVTDPDFEN
jgi:hypothetical protein